MPVIARFALLISVLLLSAAVVSPALAGEKKCAAGIKVVSSKNPDASSSEAILKDIFKPGMTSQQKCEEMFRYLTTHLYHCHAPEEPNADMLNNRKSANETTRVHDAVKQLNVYAHGLCGTQSTISNHLYNAAGFLSHVVGVQGHTTFETKYDGKWHYFDADMMGFVRDSNGRVVSIDEIKADRNLLFAKHAKRPKYYFKFDGPKTMWGALKNGVRYAMYGRMIGVHSMNLSLKDGETFTRYFKRQWAPDYRYFCPAGNTAYSKRLKQLKSGPSRDATHYLYAEKGNQRRFGNWELVFAPDLSKGTFLDGAAGSRNVTFKSSKPFYSPKVNGPAEIVFNVYSPYGCAGTAGDLSTNEDDRNGYILEGEFNSASGTVAYSFDMGKSWEKAHDGGGKFKVDLTPKFVTRYGWLLKISFEGKGAGLNTFKSYLSGQLSPASLPFVDGATEMTFTRADTECVLLEPDIAVSFDEFKRVAHKVEGLNKWTESISGHVQGKGSVVYKIDTPGDIVRVQAGAKFGGRKGTYTVQFSIDDGATWVTACKQKSVYNEKHSEEFWGQSAEGVLDFKLKKAYSPGCIKAKGNLWESAFEPKPVKSVLVKFSQQGGSLCKVYGIYTHYLKKGKLPLTITHKWNGGNHVEKIAADETTKKYTVKGGKLADNLSIIIKAGE